MLQLQLRLRQRPVVEPEAEDCEAPVPPLAWPPAAPALPPVCGVFADEAPEAPASLLPLVEPLMPLEDVPPALDEPEASPAEEEFVPPD